MKKYVVLSLCFLFLSCSNGPGRNTSSVPRDLSGSYLGVETREGVRLNSDQRAARIYLAKDPSDPGSYYTVLLQYPGMLGTGFRYAISQKWPKMTGKSRKGFLTKILERVWVHKAIPDPQNPRVFNLHRLEVQGDDIRPVESVSKQLILAKYPKDDDKLGGSKIIQVVEDQDKNHSVYFPRKKEKAKYSQELGYGQYQIARFVYESGGIKRGLNSTWHTNYIAGRYLAAYYAMYECGDELVKDHVMELTTHGEADSARLHLNPCQSKVKPMDREKQFTHPGSAFLEGDLKVIEPIEGMFLFRPKSKDTPKETVAQFHPRIGLFIDVFDATLATGEAVVELVVVDPANPQKFLMYFEDPDNVKANP